MHANAVVSLPLVSLPPLFSLLSSSLSSSYQIDKRNAPAMDAKIVYPYRTNMHSRFRKETERERVEAGAGVGVWNAFHIIAYMRSNDYYFSLWKNALELFVCLALLVNHPCRCIVQNHFQLIALMSPISFWSDLIYCKRSFFTSFKFSLWFVRVGRTNYYVVK